MSQIPLKTGVKKSAEKEESVIAKLESLILTPKTVLEWFVSTTHRINLYDNTGNINSEKAMATSSNGWAPCDNPTCAEESVHIPEEFQVREFPASSLFSLSKSSNQNSDQRLCRHHISSSDAKSRDERFYHVFKKGELEELVRAYVPSLTLVDTSYCSGHWRITLSKTTQQSHKC